MFEPIISQSLFIDTLEGEKTSGSLCLNASIFFVLFGVGLVLLSKNLGVERLKSEEVFVKS